MKRKSKPRSPAEIAKRLGITQEQLEAQAREQANECFRKEGWLGPELTPREEEELEKQSRAAAKTFEKNFPRDPDWPPFPLPDIYDDDDPHLVRAAYAAISRYRRAYVPEIGFNGKQLKAAVEVALAIRSAWSKGGFELREVPLAENLNWPTKQDFFRLEQWFLTANNAVKRELARGSGANANDMLASRKMESVDGMSEKAKAQEIARKVGSLLAPRPDVVREWRKEFEALLKEELGRRERQEKALNRAQAAIAEAFLRSKRSPLLTGELDKPPRRGYKWHKRVLYVKTVHFLDTGVGDGEMLKGWVPAGVYDTLENGREALPWLKRDRPFAIRAMRLALLHDEALPEASPLLGLPEEDTPEVAAFRGEFRVHVSGVCGTGDLGEVFNVAESDDRLDTWDDDALDGLRDDLEHVAAALANGSDGDESKEQPWKDDAPEYLSLSEAGKLIDDRLTLSALSKLCKPDGEMRYMRKRGIGCNVHLGDFRKYMKGRQGDPTWAKAYQSYLKASGKGDMRFFWTCTVCGHEYPENGTATANCPKCGGEAKIQGKRPPERRK